MMNDDTSEDSDQDIEIKELEQLTAVLESDKDDINEVNISSATSVATVSSACSNNLDDSSKIETALALNKLMDEKLGRLENILSKRLHDCRQRLIEIHSSESLRDKQEINRFLHIGKPYFKDKSNFPAPDNHDTILMEKSNMYDFSYISSVPGWTVKDKSDFINLILKYSKDIRRKELLSQIAELRRNTKSKKNREINQIIKGLNKEIDLISKKTLKELALPIDEEYDWEMLATKLNRRHSAQEYRSLWKLFLHPSINKSSWNKAEHRALQQIAYDYNLQDWDNIASNLKTNRTGYQCFVYFRTNMSNTFTGKKWTKEEEEYLKRLIDYYREDDYIPWGKVAASMENRTKIQIYNKYNRLMENRKGRFLPEEDAVILTCADTYGNDYKRMMQYLPGRSVAQLRSRYNVLNKKRISTVWTVEEDKRLLQLLANQDKTTNFSSITHYFPGKDRTNIRARYLTLAKWMNRHPNSNLKNAPRRRARLLGHGQASKNLNMAIEKLKKRIQSEVQKKKYKKVTRNSDEILIEDHIIATLVNENLTQPFYRNADGELEDSDAPNEPEVGEQDLNVTSLKKVLILLKSKLDRRLLEKSHYSEQYPGLISSEDVALKKVKCYSRKLVAKTVKIDSMPTIWGKNCLGELNYVLPPNYATITGCRKLMAYVSNRVCKDNDPLIRILARRNLHLKEQLNNLMDRCNTLFLWPLSLSNEGPPGNIKDMVMQRDKNHGFYSSYHDVKRGFISPVAIPVTKVESDNIVNDNIDLEETPKEDDISVKTMYIGNNQLMFVDSAKPKKTYFATT